MLIQEKNEIHNIGANLKKLRGDLDYSAAEMASQLGIGRTAYYKNENGDTFPGYPSLRCLSEDYGISMDWLIFNKGPMYYIDKDAETEEGYEENDPVVEMKKKPEMMELVEHMSRIPLLYYEVLHLFQKFRIENKELLKNSMAIGLKQEEE